MDIFEEDLYTVTVVGDVRDPYPEFAQMRVLRSPDGPMGETDAAERAITFDDLLTHRAGLTYADFHRGPIRLHVPRVSLSARQDHDHRRVSNGREA